MTGFVNIAVFVVIFLFLHGTAVSAGYRTPAGRPRAPFPCWPVDGAPAPRWPPRLQQLASPRLGCASGARLASHVLLASQPRLLRVASVARRGSEARRAAATTTTEGAKGHLCRSRAPCRHAAAQDRDGRRILLLTCSGSAKGHYKLLKGLIPVLCT